jgi:hypothetical protein
MARWLGMRRSLRMPVELAQASRTRRERVQRRKGAARPANEAADAFTQEVRRHPALTSDHPDNRLTTC